MSNSPGLLKPDILLIPLWHIQRKAADQWCCLLIYQLRHPVMRDNRLLWLTGAPPASVSAAAIWRLFVDDLCEYIIIEIYRAKRGDRCALTSVTSVRMRFLIVEVLWVYSFEFYVDVFVFETVTSDSRTYRRNRAFSSKFVMRLSVSGGVQRLVTTTRECYVAETSLIH